MIIPHNCHKNHTRIKIKEYNYFANISSMQASVIYQWKWGERKTFYHQIRPFWLKMYQNSRPNAPRPFPANVQRYFCSAKTHFRTNFPPA